MATRSRDRHRAGYAAAARCRWQLRRVHPGKLPTPLSFTASLTVLAAASSKAHAAGSLTLGPHAVKISSTDGHGHGCVPLHPSRQDRLFLLRELRDRDIA